MDNQATATPKVKKLWILAGETSGDIYGAKIAGEAREMAAKDGVTLEISGMGGTKMREAGVNIIVDSTELGVMGFIEVFKLIGVFIWVFLKLLFKAKKERPDAVLLIDYPGFNLRFAKAMYRNHIPVIWYVSPQIWVWGKHRKPTLAKICTKMMVIFPFEVDVYKDTKLDVEFVGHPLLEQVAERTDPSIQRDENCFLLLPGSRMMEINRLLRPMLESAIAISKTHPDMKFVISTPRDRVNRACEKLLCEFRRTHPDLPEVELTCGQTAYYMQKAIAGLAASGTVTVEAAIADLPLVVAYKMNVLTIVVASWLVTLYRGFFTMVNIILNRPAFEEFLQWHAETPELVPAIEKILPGGSRRAEVMQDMQELRKMLAPDGAKPSDRAAEVCLEVLKIK